MFHTFKPNMNISGSRCEYLDPHSYLIPSPDFINSDFPSLNTIPMANLIYHTRVCVKSETRVFKSS